MPIAVTNTAHFNVSGSPDAGQASVAVASHAAAAGVAPRPAQPSATATAHDATVSTDQLTVPTAAFTLGTEVGVPTGTSLTTRTSRGTNTSTGTYELVDPTGREATRTVNVLIWENIRFTGIDKMVAYPTSGTDVWLFRNCRWESTGTSRIVELDSETNPGDYMHPKTILENCEVDGSSLSGKALNGGNAWIINTDARLCEDGWAGAFCAVAIHSNFVANTLTGSPDPHADGIQHNGIGQTVIWNCWVNGGVVPGAASQGLRVGAEFGPNDNVTVAWCCVDAGAGGYSLQVRGDNSPTTGNTNFRAHDNVIIDTGVGPVDFVDSAVTLWERNYVGTYGGTLIPSPAPLDAAAEAAAATAAAHDATIETTAGFLAGPSNTGHEAHPSWPGSFTGGVSPWIRATTGQTFEFVDFTEGVDVGSPSVAANNVTFIGCRFRFSANVSDQGNNGAALVLLFGDNVQFHYCTFQPDTSNYPTRLTGEEIEADPSTWVSYGKGYQYALNGGGGFNSYVTNLLVDHCDFWGFGNALELAGSTLADPHIVRYSWFHHGADPFIVNQTANQFHNDCWLVNAGGYHGAQCLYNRMEIWGNTNCLAWQGAGAYNDSQIVGNRFGGDQETVVISASGTSARVTFTDNEFATRIGRSVGTGRPLRSWSVSDDGAGSLWARNRYVVGPTESQANYPGANWGNPAWDGLYWHPGDDDTTGGHAAEYVA